MLKRLLAACFLFWASGASAAELGGVRMADTIQIGGQNLVLNGMGMRTYSVLHVHIYVAGLYLERPNTNANAILNSNETKLVQFVFSRDIKAEDARKSWQDGLNANCTSPCKLPPDEVAQFLASVPAVRQGDTGVLLFTRQGLDVTMNNRPLGHISDQNFARVILATFIGPQTQVPELRAGLLKAGG
ncbi:chalcone isomerase family protein [Roseomonas elaeocarpi]|uniref:Chalcone isomerase family protein n=1 Tax=Roseomonas elaeocarpi TaxID=907779 RepID=A0ABV6JVM9_9PROT